MSVRILIGDVRERLKELPDGSVHCVVTSPPYWGLRDYGVAGQIGLEETLFDHIDAGSHRMSDLSNGELDHLRSWELAIACERVKLKALKEGRVLTNREILERVDAEGKAP